MTFLEAAIEILRSAEDPLHFTEIARLAVERKLLSHVGRDPEAAMRSCLNSAVRGKVHDNLVMRSKPGTYRLRPGVAIPELPPPPSDADPLPVVGEAEAEAAKEKRRASKKKPSKSKKSSTRSKSSTKKKTTKRTRRKKDPEPKDEAEVDSAKAGKDDTTEAADTADTTKAEGEGPSDDEQVVPMPELDPSKVKFRGPEGSGLEDETDIAVVMANAMSRLVGERPELREELEAMQKSQSQAPEAQASQSGPEVIEVGRKRRRDDDSNSRERDDERNSGGRRRRRRRRRSKRVEWSDNSARRQSSRGDELLDKVAAVLAEAGPRSLHVRQIAENLAAQNVLEGEISEIERAVTASILLDVHRRGDGSRFAVRGDARYQLQGGRLPEKAASAEHALRNAIRSLEKETELQLLAWLQSLGARSLESLVRVWLDLEGYTLVATLPPSRGLGKLVVEDPEAEDDEGKTLVLVLPRKTSLEPKLWDGEAERNQCSNTLVFAMCEPNGESSDARVIHAPELTQWLVRNKVGVRTLKLEVSVLDPSLIESIGGLDT